MASKRTLDAFLSPPPTKRVRLAEAQQSTTSEDKRQFSRHSTYPFPIPHYPPHIESALAEVPASEGKEINDKPDLDLLYFRPYIPRDIAGELFEFLRSELFFYRVKYKIKRGSVETDINTPRFTTVFGVDETSRFTDSGSLIETSTQKPILPSKYTCSPRPLPQILDSLRQITEIFTQSTYNFCLVNYYASGSDSISFHSDDERFLGPNPAIASFSLGATRDFLLKHKLPKNAPPGIPQDKPLKYPLAGGDMILMRGPTQSNWLHSIPKRSGKGSEGGRINITFRKAMVKGGTENYYQYNVGKGEVYKWDMAKNEMRPWTNTAA